MDFMQELTALLNRYSIEEGSNTPDFILAQYIRDCLTAFSQATLAREAWYNRVVPFYEGEECDAQNIVALDREKSIGIKSPRRR